MAAVYNGIWAGDPYLPTGNQAFYKLFAKRGKDPLEPRSYRPIFLLNLDVKIFSKIVATRLTDILTSLIHNAQSGFIKGWTVLINIPNVLMILECARSHPPWDL